MHQHGWECFRTSGGYANAADESVPLAERIETLYKTAYRTGHRNGIHDAHQQHHCVGVEDAEPDHKRDSGG